MVDIEVNSLKQIAVSYKQRSKTTGYKFVFKVSSLICLDNRVQTGAPLSVCRINNSLVKFTVTSR